MASNVHNKTIKITDIEWDKDDPAYEEKLPTSLTVKESDLGLDNEEYTEEELKDAIEEHLFGNYCGTHWNTQYLVQQ